MRFPVKVAAMAIPLTLAASLSGAQPFVEVAFDERAAPVPTFIRAEARDVLGAGPSGGLIRIGVPDTEPVAPPTVSAEN